MGRLLITLLLHLPFYLIKKVVYLKRLSMGDLILDPQLGIGEYRALTEEELESLKKNQ